MEDLTTLSDADLVSEYRQALQIQEEAAERIRQLEDEHFARDFGKTALRWIVETSAVDS